MTEQGGFIDNHGDDTTSPAEPVSGTISCATCGERPPRPGRLRCQECLDAEWLRLRAKDPGVVRPPQGLSSARIEQTTGAG